MYPHLHVGPITLQTFGLMFALAFLAAGALVWKRLGEIGKPVDWAYEIGFSALVKYFVSIAHGLFDARRSVATTPCFARARITVDVLRWWSAPRMVPVDDQWPFPNRLVRSSATAALSAASCSASLRLAVP